jgi:hypothetical protein
VESRISTIGYERCWDGPARPKAKGRAERAEIKRSEASSTHHDMPAPEEGLAELHELGDRVVAVADVLLQLRRDEPRCLGDVELETPGEALLGERADLGGARRDRLIVSLDPSP